MYAICITWKVTYTYGIIILNVIATINIQCTQAHAGLGINIYSVHAELPLCTPCMSILIHMLGYVKLFLTSLQINYCLPYFKYESIKHFTIIIEVLSEVLLLLIL